MNFGFIDRGVPNLQPLIDKFASQLKNLPPHEARLHARKEYDQALDALRAWSLLWNHIAPANCLPEEVLRQIFTLLEQKAPLRKRTSNGHTRGWVEVTHVCRRWRAVALNSPELWTSVNVELVDTPWIGAGLARCGGERTLRVSLHEPVHLSNTERYQSMRKLLLSMIPRANHLRLALPYGVTYLFAALPTPPATLKTLDLSTHKGNNNRISENETLIRNAFNFMLGDLPSVESLKLHRVVESPSRFAKGDQLRHLEISQQHTFDRGFNITNANKFDELMAFLRSTPKLVTMTLHNAGPSVFDRDVHLEPAEPRVELLHLEVLRLRGSTSAYEILPHLYVPACIHADIYFARRKEIALPFMLPAQSYFWDSWENADIPAHTMTMMASRKGRELSIDCVFLARQPPGGDSDIPKAQPEHLPPRRKLSLCFEPLDTAAAPQALRETMAHVPRYVLPTAMSTLKEMHIVNFGSALHMQQWQEVFSLTTQLRALHLRGTKLKASIEALKPGWAVVEGEEVIDDNQLDVSDDLRALKIECISGKPETREAMMAYCYRSGHS